MRVTGLFRTSSLDISYATTHILRSDSYKIDNGLKINLKKSSEARVTR